MGPCGWGWIFVRKGGCSLLKVSPASVGRGPKQLQLGSMGMRWTLAPSHFAHVFSIRLAFFQSRFSPPRTLTREHHHPRPPTHRRPTLWLTQSTRRSSSFLLVCWACLLWRAWRPSRRYGRARRLAHRRGALSGCCVPSGTNCPNCCRPAVPLADDSCRRCFLPSHCAASITFPICATSCSM